MENDLKNKSQHWLIMGFLAIGLLIIAAVMPDLSIYAFLVAVSIIGFMLYLKVIEKISTFEKINYNKVMEIKLYSDAVRSFRKEFKGIYLTGEDVIPYKWIADCVGFFSYSFDIFKKKIFEDDDELKNAKGLKELTHLLKFKNNQSIEVWGFFYHLYDNFFLFKHFQKTIPNIPIINKLCKMIPLIKDITYPQVKGIITTKDRIMFKRDIVELRGKSLTPLSIKEDSAIFSVLEYNNKYDESRLMEKFMFSKEIYADLINEFGNISKNAVNIAAQLNPQVKVENEQSIMQK